MSFARKAVGASASSLFLVDDGERSLHGLISDWDWTRTSFSSQLDDWPSVAAVLSAGKMGRIDAARAHAGEKGWFEARGIVSTVCVPMRDRERPLGVLFFDFAEELVLDSESCAFLDDVGRRCARALVRESISVGPVHAPWAQ